MKQNTQDKPIFVMVNKNLWESGLGAALGPKAFFALMAIARHLKKDMKAWPSVRTVAKHLGVSEQTAGAYVKELLAFRLLDGTPLVTWTERPTGRRYQSNRVYQFHPICQVTSGGDAAPIDPGIVPKPKKRSEASTQNIQKARSVVSAKRMSAQVEAQVQSV